MLVLTRKPAESIVIDGGIRITVLSIQGGQIRLGFEAPDQVRVLRGELIDPPPPDVDDLLRHTDTRHP